MDTERRKQAQATEIAGVESRTNIEKEVAENAARQRTARDDLRRDVREQREQWTAAQKDLVDTSQTDADKARTKLTTDVATEREKGTTAADEHIAEGNRAATTAREDAERKAREARSQGEAEPTGFLGWVASQAKAFFERIKTAISNAFEAARKAVKQAIETAQKLATEAIDAARKAVVKAIKAAGDALIEIGDRVLAGFPRLRTKFRGAIRETVGAAERVVNALADGLKAAVQAYLDLYAKALNGILGLLETGLLAVVDGYAATVQGMIQAAQFVLNGLGDLLQVAKDIASGPRAWLRNLGAAIADGVRNHLWAALKIAVSEWFDAKVDAILGLGKLVWNVLAKGGITFAAVAKFAFAALKKVIPVTLVRLLITKLIGLLVPAAAAVMAIIEGIQAAWAAAGSVIGAISKFIVFLKAVKGGSAGLQFAEALAAAAVAVIEFISSWLLQRLLKSAAKVGKAIKSVASKIAAKLKRLVQTLKRGIKKLTRRVKVWMRRTGRRFKKLKERFFGKGKKKPRHKMSPAEKLARAQRELPPKIQPLLDQGVTALWLGIQLVGWRLRYRLGSLRVVRSRSEGKAKITATGSKPQVDIVRQIIDASGDRLRKMIRKIADDIFKEPQVKKRADYLARQRRKGRGRTKEEPIITGPPGLVTHAGQALDLRRGRERGVFFHEVQTGTVTGVVREVQLQPKPGNIILTLHPHKYVEMAAEPEKIFGTAQGRIGLQRLNAIEGGRASIPLVLLPAAHGLAWATETGTAGEDPRGHATRTQALIKLNPAQPLHAGVNLRELERRAGGPDPGESTKHLDEWKMGVQRRRINDLLIALVYQKMTVAGRLTSSEQTVGMFIDKELRDALYSAFVEGLVKAL
jgi:hypothetical protein